MLHVSSLAMHSPSIKLLPSKGDLLRWETDIAKTGRKAKKEKKEREKCFLGTHRGEQMSAEADACFSGVKRRILNAVRILVT